MSAREGGPVIALVDYGAGNLRSVELALERLGVTHRRAATAEALEAADGIILPGVGAAASAMRELESRGLVEPLRAARGPLLGICLGMQLLTESSDEDSGGRNGDASPVGCLGVIPGRTRRFRADVRLPQIGWNSVRLARDPLFEGLSREEHFYFLHGHRVECEAEYRVGEAEYGEAFPAAVRNGRAAGLQFHPEKSGSAGLRVLWNFCGICGDADPDRARGPLREADG